MHKLITFRQLKENCHHKEVVGDTKGGYKMFCHKVKQHCTAANCPVWKKLKVIK